MPWFNVEKFPKNVKKPQKLSDEKEKRKKREIEGKRAYF